LIAYSSKLKAKASRHKGIKATRQRGIKATSKYRIQLRAYYGRGPPR
jgi:hypothetical protein